MSEVHDDWSSITVYEPIPVRLSSFFKIYIDLKELFRTVASQRSSQPSRKFYP
jgi:hypothetical protein